MTYTVTKMITNAFYTSGIVSVDFQTVSGAQLNMGLDLFNELLGEEFLSGSTLPYYEVYNFDAVVGQEKYTIPNLLGVESLTFFINDVRFSTLEVPRVRYFGSSRADNVQSLPYSWHLEREKGGASIYLYFKPSEAFPMELWGRFGLSSAALNSDLEETYDSFYITYLKYLLAERLCLNYNYDPPPMLREQVLKLEMKMRNSVAPLDLTMQKVSTLGKKRGVNFAQANLGRGWSTS